MSNVVAAGMLSHMISASSALLPWGTAAGAVALHRFRAALDAGAARRAYSPPTDGSSGHRGGPGGAPSSSGSSGDSGTDAYHEAEAGAASSSGRSRTAADDGEAPLTAEQRRKLLGEVLREAQLAEAGMSKFFRAQQLVLRGRPDAAYFADQEQQRLEDVQRLMPRYRARPSLLLAAAKAAGTGAGALAAAAPARLRDAVVGGLQDALTEAYNEQLGELRRQGLSDDEPEVRQLLRALRDLERAPDGAPPPPDVLALQQGLAGVGAEGVVGAAAKAAALALLGLGKRL